MKGYWPTVDVDPPDYWDKEVECANCGDLFTVSQNSKDDLCGSCERQRDYTAIPPDMNGGSAQ